MFWGREIRKSPTTSAAAASPWPPEPAGGRGRHPSPGLRPKGRPRSPREPARQVGRLRVSGGAGGRGRSRAPRGASPTRPDSHDRGCSVGSRRNSDVRRWRQSGPPGLGVPRRGVSAGGLRQPRRPNPRARCHRLFPSPTGRYSRRLRGGVGIKGLRSPRRDESATGPELRPLSVRARLHPTVLTPPGIQNLHSRVGSRRRGSTASPQPPPRAAVPTDGAAFGFADLPARSVTGEQPGPDG